jgi:hypothetical protein
MKNVLEQENVLAVVVFLAFLGLVVFLRGASPTFVYQGF